MKTKPPSFQVNIHSVQTPNTVLITMPFDSIPAAMEVATAVLRGGWVVSIKEVPGKRPYTRKAKKLGRPKGVKNKKPV